MNKVYFKITSKCYYKTELETTIKIYYRKEGRYLYMDYYHETEQVYYSIDHDYEFYPKFYKWENKEISDQLNNMIFKSSNVPPKLLFDIIMKEFN